MKIKGYFERKKPFLRLYFKNRKRFVDCLVDTGFSGYLALPQELIKKLKLQNIGEGKYLTARGRHFITYVYVAFIYWFGELKKVTAIATKGIHPLIGMGLLYDNKLEMYPSKDLIVISK